MKTRYNTFTFIFILMLSTIKISAQSAKENFVRTRTFSTENATEWIDRIQYSDGLGRLQEEVLCHYTPTHQSLVTLYEYDELGRQSNVWNPAPIGQIGDKYVEPETVKKQAKTFYADTNPYSYPQYEKSPLNRTMEEYGPGQDWHTNGKSVKTTYLTNSATETNLRCRKFSVASNGTTLSMSGEHAANTLSVVKYEDEDGNVSYEFRNGLNQLILQRQVFSTSQNYDTYYAYTNYGNLAFVLPPIAVDEIITDKPSGTGNFTATNAILKKYVYCYEYDERNRCIKKRIPGCEWESYVYDKTDRLIFYQDARHSGTTTWFFTIPDAFGRTVLKGLCTAFGGSSINISLCKKMVVTAEYSGTGNYLGYKIMKDGASTTLTANPILEAYYYDNYDFISMASSSNQSVLKYATTNPDYATRFGNDNDKTAAKGLLTGKTVYRLEQTAANNYIYSAFYYDYRGNMIQSRTTNTLGAYDYEYMKYNFSGHLVKKQHSHASGNGPIAEHYEYEYDHAGRHTNTYHTLGTGTRMHIEQITYDELGRVKAQSPRGLEVLKTSYAYNVRSWPTELKGSKFSQKIYYNQKYDQWSPTYYNGNIAGVSWNEGTTEKAYTFNYDNLSRLTSNSYYVNGRNTYAYRSAYTYDKHGNPTKITRVVGPTSSGSGNGPSDYIDNLTFTYNGNQILTIKDTGTKTLGSYDYDFKDYSGGSASAKYEYDKAGFITKDPYKGATFIFHATGMPKKTTVPAVQGTIEYNYLADGTKTRVKYEYNPSLSLNPLQNTGNNSTTKTTVTYIYSGNKVYKNSTSNLDKILLPNGYFKGSNYYFYLRDYQGNVRVVVNQAGTVVQENHYLPFGMPTADGTKHEEQPYKYSQKEYDTMMGMNMYDFHARQYDSPTIRFRSPDPMAEKYYNISPYAYCANNPIKYVDPTGESINLANMQLVDDVWKTNYTNDIISDLSSQTGLSYTISSDGNLTYAKDESGNPIISTITDKNGNVIQQGSATARNLMIGAIDHSDVITVGPAARSLTKGETNEIGLSPKQIEAFINGSNNVDNKTLGWGMTLMHEIHHTNVGGGLSDAPYKPGPVVTSMNKIRSELNAQGGNYGQRLDYPSTVIGSSQYIPFNSSSQSLLGSGIIPATPKDKYIKFK